MKALEHRWNVVEIQPPQFCRPGQAIARVLCGSCRGRVFIRRNHIEHVMTGWSFDCSECGASDRKRYPTKADANRWAYEFFARGVER